MKSKWLSKVAISTRTDMTITSLYDKGDIVFFKCKSVHNNTVIASGKIVNLIFTADNYTWWYVIEYAHKNRTTTVKELHTRKQTEIAKTREQLREILRIC